MNVRLQMGTCIDIYNIARNTPRSSVLHLQAVTRAGSEALLSDDTMPYS